MGVSSVAIETLNKRGVVAVSVAKRSPEITLPISRRFFLEMSLTTGVTFGAWVKKVYEVSNRLQIGLEQANWIAYQDFLDKRQINYSIKNRIAWEHEVLLRSIKPQEFDLSCEFKALQILGILNELDLGTEQALINRVTKSTDPNMGVHPELKNVLNNGSQSRWGQLPPKPYGIYPKPLWNDLRQSIPNLKYHDSEGSSDNKGKGEGFVNTEQYLSTVKNLLKSGNPVMAWTHCSEDVGIYKNKTVPYEHAVVLTGIGEDYLMGVDPINLQMFRYRIEEFAQRANDVGMGIMWLEKD